MKILVRPIILLSLLSLSGCTGLNFLEPTVDKSRFYYMEEVQGAFTGTMDIAILIGPQTISKHLDRSTIAWFPGDNTVAYSDNNRWAAPLSDNVSRLLASSLSSSLGTSLVGTTKEMPSLDWDYRVGFHINKLGGIPGQTVEFQVSWWLVRKDSREEHFDGAVYSTNAVTGENFDAYVQAIRDVILQWSEDVTEAIKTRR